MSRWAQDEPKARVEDIHRTRAAGASIWVLKKVVVAFLQNELRVRPEDAQVIPTADTGEHGYVVCVEASEGAKFGRGPGRIKCVGFPTYAPEEKSHVPPTG
jgi:hypothetical protein